MDTDCRLMTLNADMDSLQREINELEDRLKRAKRQLANTERRDGVTGPLRSQVENYRQKIAEVEHRWNKKSREVEKLIAAEKKG